MRTEEITTIHCCFITDDAYIVPTATAIQSLIETKAPDVSLVVHILAADLSGNSSSLFESLRRADVEVDIRRVSLEKLRGLHNTHKMGICMATPAALLKFAIADIFAEQDRMLYLDGDMLFRGDLSDLYNTDLGDNVIAAVRDLGACWWQHAYVKKVHTYINTGVMLMDLVKMRNEGIAQKLLETKRSLVDSMFMDQDVFNVVMDGRVKILPLIYNASMPQMIWSYRRGSYDFEMLNKYYGSDYYNFAEIHKAAVVIHFSSKYKPWKYSNAPLGDEWMPVFQRSVASHVKLNLVKGEDFYLGFTWYRWLNRNLPGKKMEAAADYEYRLVADRGRRLEADMGKRIDEAVKKSCAALQCENRKLSTEVGIVRGENNALAAQCQVKAMAVPARVPGDRLIASLTSYPARMATIHLTIESIFCQTLKPDEVVLWLCREEFPENYAFPKALDYCFAKGLHVEWVDDNVKPHKKYLFALRKYPDANIITFDDDSVYPSTRIAELYASHLKFPKAVIAARVHRIVFDADGKIMPYSAWSKNSSVYVNRPMFSLCPVGVGGVLYPPHCLPPEADDIPKIKELCLCADDLWLKMMEVVNRVPVVRSNSENLSEPIVDGTQETALWKQNCTRGENDIQLLKVCEYCSQLRAGFNVLTFLFEHRDEGRVLPSELNPSVPVRAAFKPQVSVVVPVCNVAKYLEKCVESILMAIKMSGLDVEVIFVDDGSTDGSQNILRAYLKKNRNFGAIFQLNSGAGVARNKGLEAARGEFVCFCDPDDWIDPLMIDKLYRRAISDGSDVVLCGRTLYNDAQKQFTGISLYEAALCDRFPTGFTPDDVADKIFNAFYYVPWGKIIRRRMLMDMNIRFPGMPRNEDMSFANSVLVASRRISIVNEPLYYYRRNRVDSLQYGVENTPYTQIEASRWTLKFIRENGMYDRYRDSFIKFVFMESAMRLRELSGRESVAKEFYERLQSEFVKEFDIHLLSPKSLRLDMRKPLSILLEGGDFSAFMAAVNVGRKSVPEARAKQKGKISGNATKMERELVKAKCEVQKLKSSAAYRVGMFVTWPFRKVYRSFC